MATWFWWGTEVLPRGFEQGMNLDFLLSTFGAIAMVPNLPGHPVYWELGPPVQSSGHRKQYAHQ